jgi:hypothetical protein
MIASHDDRILGSSPCDVRPDPSRDHGRELPFPPDLYRIHQSPPAAEGSPFDVEPIEGRVVGAKPGQQIVLYAKSNIWWIQPIDAKPFTSIGPDSVWRNSTHPGNEYRMRRTSSGA